MARRGRRQFIRMLVARLRAAHSGSGSPGAGSGGAARRARCRADEGGDAARPDERDVFGPLGVPADGSSGPSHTAAVQLEHGARLHPLVLDEALGRPTAFVARGDRDEQEIVYLDAVTLVTVPDPHALAGRSGQPISIASPASDPDSTATSP